jgi:hypothetical protein
VPSGLNLPGLAPPLPSWRIVASRTPLTAVVESQFRAYTATAFTTGSITPVASSLYIAFTIGRTQNVPHRVPTMTGTNGWNVPWTRVPAATAIYIFPVVTPIDRAGTDVFWAVAANGTAGTINWDYGSGSNYAAGTLHLIRIDGGPDTVNPIGATASANTGGNTPTSLNATLTATPASTSIVVACGSSDLNSGTMTPGANYTSLGSMQQGNALGITQTEYDEAPTSTTVGVTFDGADIIAVSAVEVLIAGGATARPATIAAVASVPTPTLLVRTVTDWSDSAAATAQTPGDVVATPATIAAVASVPTPTVLVSTNAIATPATIAVAAAVPTPTLLVRTVTDWSSTAVDTTQTSGANAVATPATIAVTTSVPAPAILAAALPTPATVGVAVSVPAPTVLAAARPTPSTVSAVTAVLTPTAKAAAITTPATVAAVTAVPSPTVVVSGYTFYPWSDSATETTPSGVVTKVMVVMVGI